MMMPRVEGRTVMSTLVRRAHYLAIAIVCTASLAAVAQKPAVPDLLKAVGDYLLQYTEKLATIAAEEEYTQRQPEATQASRRLNSDIVLIGHKGGSISAFRYLDYYSALMTVRGAESRRGRAVAFDIDQIGKRRVIDSLP